MNGQQVSIQQTYSNRRAHLADLSNIKVEEVCCHNCVRQQGVDWCAWFHCEIKDEFNDYCKFFIKDF